MHVGQSTIAILISSLALLGTGVGAYTSVKAEQATQHNLLQMHSVQLDKLDNYDLILGESINLNRESVVRMETLFQGSEANTARLATAMDSLQLDIKDLTKAIYKLDKT